MTTSSLLEYAGVGFNLLAVALAWRRHIGTWPAGLVGAVLAGVVFGQTGLYADAGLQVLFFGQVLRANGVLVP